MAQFTFDPTNADECELALSVIALTSGTAETPAAAPVVETPVETPNTPEPVVDALQAVADAVIVDSAGIPWNPDCHTSNKATKADGTWKMKPGAKDAYEAHNAAHAAAKTEAAGAAMTAPVEAPAAPVETPAAPTAPAGMPGAAAMPGSPTPNTPQPPLEYDAVAQRFVDMLAKYPGSDYSVIYNDLSINVDTFDTDQSAMRRLWAYMDAIDAGQDYASAIAAGNSNG